MESILQELENKLKHWWVSLLVGIVFIIAAVVVICQPITSYVFISLIFSVSVLTSGIFEIIFSVINRQTLPKWGWNLCIGIIDLILGLVLCMTPTLSMEVLPILLAFWFAFKGFSLIANSIFLKQAHSKGWGWFLFFGILIIICSVYILFYPSIGALYMIYMLSIILFIVGVVRIATALNMRKVYKKVKQ